MNYTIDQQLSRLEAFKTSLKNAINQANPSQPLTSNRLDDFVTHILNYLGPKQEPTQQYTVTFNKNGGSGSAPTAQTVNAGTTIQLPNYRGTKEGYTQVSGWATSASATTPQYEFGANYTVTGNVTLYAVYTINKNKIAWSNPEIGGVITAKVGTSNIVNDSTLVQYNKEVILTYTPPTGSLVSSIDWFGGDIVEITPVTSNTGKFIMPDKYVTGITANVVLKQGANVVATSEQPEYGEVTGSGFYEIGTEAIITANPNEGYKFVAWDDGSNENPKIIPIEKAEDIIIKGTFEVEEEGIRVEAVEYLCQGECPEFELSDFKVYNEHLAEIETWFNIKESKLMWYMDGEIQLFGDLKKHVYNDRGSGIDIEDSKGVYWIAIPSDTHISSFIMNYGTDFQEELIEKFDVLDELIKIENVDIQGASYNVYGVYGMYSNKLHITLVQ